MDDSGRKAPDIPAARSGAATGAPSHAASRVPTLARGTQDYVQVPSAQVPSAQELSTLQAEVFQVNSVDFQHGSNAPGSPGASTAVSTPIHSSRPAMHVTGMQDNPSLLTLQGPATIRKFASSDFTSRSHPSPKAIESAKQYQALKPPSYESPRPYSARYHSDDFSTPLIGRASILSAPPDIARPASGASLQSGAPPIATTPPAYQASPRGSHAVHQASPRALHAVQTRRFDPVSENIPLEYVDLETRVSTVLGLMESSKSQIDVVFDIIENFDRNTFYNVPKFSTNTAAIDPFTYVVLLPVFIVSLVVSLISVILAFHNWLVFLTALTILVLTGLLEYTEDEKLDEMKEFLGILAIVQSCLIAVIQMFTAGGLDRIPAPTVTYSAAYMCAIFRSTDTKEREVKRLLGISGLNANEVGLIAQVRSESESYLRGIVKMHMWHAFLRHTVRIGGDCNSAIIAILNTLERDRIRMSTWSVVEALEWANSGFEKHHNNVLMSLEGDLFVKFIEMLRSPADLKRILMNETLSAETMLYQLIEENRAYEKRVQSQRRITYAHNVQQTAYFREVRMIKSAMQKFERGEKLDHEEDLLWNAYLSSNANSMLPSSRSVDVPRGGASGLADLSD